MCCTCFNPTDEYLARKWYFLSRRRDYLRRDVALRWFLTGFLFFFSCTHRREAEERSGIATGDESLLCEERDRAGSEAGAKEQRPPTGLAAERSGRTASQIAAEMHRQFVRRLPHAADIAVAAAADPYDAALLLGLVSRAGQT